MDSSNQNIRIYGTNWCSDCTRSKAFLDNHEIEYAWFNIELNPELQKYVRKINNGKQIVPIIISSDDSVKFNPAHLHSLNST